MDILYQQTEKIRIKQMPERNEKVLFKELEKLCLSSGYIHAIAYFCFRDNTIRYSDVVRQEDVLQKNSKNPLIRTEISMLIGLACKKEIDETLPTLETIQEYINKTESLLRELHLSMVPSLSEMLDLSKFDGTYFNLFKSGALLREPIFYSGESAYHFQYRDFSKEKYQKDNDWFIKNRGYSPAQAISVISSIQLLQNDKINEAIQSTIEKHSHEWSILPAYTFTAKEIAAKSEVSLDTTNSVLQSFISPIQQTEFNAPDDFNPTNAYPIISLKENKYALFQNYSLVEALYETPFFWFNEDSNYRNTAMLHRGEFTEEFSAKRLKLVFGQNRVFQNIDIIDAKGNKAGEIDVLVTFANRAIVLQAKSKKLTVSARKGNHLCLKDDFKKAVQDAYDQAFLCSSFLTDNSYKLLDTQGNEIKINRGFKEIYPFCVLSDHYPALSFQARQFLKQKTTNLIKPAFVMDVFFLDVMTEMLQSPLHFLSYANRRTLYADKILTTQELTILSYHLKHNLWIDCDYTMMHLDDDFCADLDLAMLSRRNGLFGQKTPEGILTKYKDTHFEQIIKDIELHDHPSTVDFGFMLLTLGGDSIEMINDGISKLVKLSRADGKHHDFTLTSSGNNTGLAIDRNTGLTIHCNGDPNSEAINRLNRYCMLRKYEQKAEQWFGICIDSSTARLRFGINKDFEWQQSHQMDEKIKGLQPPQSVKGKKKINFETVVRKTNKTGRNDKCPCGSGKKFKKCCL